MRKAIYVFVILFAAGLALRLTVFSPMTLPKDEKIVEQFQRTKPELIELATLLNSQPAEIEGIAPDGVTVARSLSATT